MKFLSTYWLRLLPLCLALTIGGGVVVANMRREPAPNSAASGLRAPGVSIHGMDSGLTDEQLTLRVSLVVIGTVTEGRTTKFIDDPDLPSDWSDDPETAAVVNSGAGHRVSTVVIEQWLKGTSGTTIYVEQGTQGAGNVVAGSGLTSAGDPVLIGHKYRFYLSADPWFQGYWIVERSIQLT